MSNVFIRLISEFKDSGFKKANKSTLALSRNFDKLKRSAARAFLTIAGITALKRSVKAFAANDKAINSLSKALTNLGFKYDALSSIKFIEDLEKATAVSKEELYPAYRNLVNATLDITKSQGLLTKALDIAAGTGASVETTVTALSRAYNGNFTSLGKLQNGYTSAELEALGFEKAVELLSNEFSGQAATDADTYEGKIRKLSLAFGDAGEAIGEGVVDALEALGGGNYDQGLNLIAEAGERIGNAFRFISKTIATADFLFRKGGLFKSANEIKEFQLTLNGVFGAPDPAKGRALARERSKYLRAEQARTEKIRKERERIAKLLEKEKNNQKIIAEAQKGFDLERIQIEAALKGKINDVEEYRLKLQRAILNENVDNIIKYTGLLKEAESQAAELAQLLADLPEMVENPFTDWPAVIARIQYLLKALDWQIPIDVLFAEKGLRLDQDKMTVTKLDSMNVNANNVYVNGALSGNKAPTFAAPSLPWAGIDMSTPAGSMAAATIAVNDALAAESEAAIALAEAEAEVAVIDAMIAEFDAAMAEFEASQILPGVTPATTVNVTVQGNVTSEEDLVEVITDQLYQYQKTGKGLLYSSVAV